MSVESKTQAPKSGVEIRAVAPEEDGVRLDRWFRRQFPGLTQGRVEKLLRTGQIRVDGGRAKAAQRLQAGQQVRVPPLDGAARAPAAPRRGDRPVSARDAADLQALLLHRDRHVLVLNKPAGLAVQGGSKTDRHLDGMLDALKFDAKERPRLVHRLDRDTSGVLVLARSAAAAARLAEAFRERSARKTYWAIVAGAPELREGEIRLALAKRPGGRGERMQADETGGKRAVTRYSVIDRAKREAAWLALQPLTGRTHQLRVHCAEIGTPILGDSKYGRRDDFSARKEIGRGLHLHAHAIDIAHPAGGRLVQQAPPPEHMRRTMRFLGFEPSDYEDPFVDI